MSNKELRDWQRYVALKSREGSRNFTRRDYKRLRKLELKGHPNISICGDSELPF